MLSSISSASAGTLSAMQSLRSLNKQVATLQTQIATGKRVNTAKDNSAIWSLSNKLNTDLTAGREVAKSLSIASSTVATASTAAESSVEILQKMKTALTQYQTTGTAIADAATALTQMQGQITDIVGAATFQGTSLFASSGTQDFIADASGSVISVTKKDLTGGTSYAALTSALGTAASYTAVSTALDNAIKEVKGVATYFGNQSSIIDTRTSFLNKLNDNLSSAVSALVDTDMDEAAARLTSLQTQQQLASQLLSISTQNSSTLVQTLFRSF